MRSLLYTLLFLSSPIFLWAQSEEAGVRQAINYYIEGTSYNKPELIRKAFHEELELFLDGKEPGTLRLVPAAEYIGYFEKGEYGKFTGRIGHILSVETWGNIAMAKAEILVPSRKIQFIDMFILKKLQGKWKIMSKTANSQATNQEGKQVLFVLSNAKAYGQSDLPNGNSFMEIVEAYDTYLEAGYHVDFVSPEGGAVPIRYVNAVGEVGKKYFYDQDLQYALETTYRPDEIQALDYQAIYYVGGGAAMYGVPENKNIQKIAMQIYEEGGGVVSSVCHGTAGIVNLKTKEGKYLVDGKRVSGYPEAYENKEAEYFKQFPFLIQKTIEKRGGSFHVAPRNNAHTEVDGRLITGQNNLSSRNVALKVIETLQKSEAN